MGAIAFFGDKYGDVVRVLEAGRHSLELCGGTHVRATGDIGTIKIVSEGSIGSNLRRIEAVTGTNSVALLQRDERELARAAQLLGTSADTVVDGIEKRLEEIRALRDELKARAGEGGDRPGRRAGRCGHRRRRGGARRRARHQRPPRPRSRRAPAAGRACRRPRRRDRHRRRGARGRRHPGQRAGGRRPPRGRGAGPSRVAAVGARATSPWPAARTRAASTRRWSSPGRRRNDASASPRTRSARTTRPALGPPPHCGASGPLGPRPVPCGCSRSTSGPSASASP